MLAILLVSISLLFQAIAAFLALRLIPASGVRLPWVMISAAMSVRFLREGITLWLALVQGFRLSLFEEILALAVSTLLLLGTALIKPLFLQLKNSLTEREELLEKARQARRRSDEERLRLRAVIEHLPVGVFILDADGRIVEVNEAADRIWGGEAPLSASVADYKAYKGWWVATGEPIRAQEWAAARAIMKGETSLGETIDIERRDGTRGTILNSAAPIRSPDGEIVGAVAVNQDVTELRRLQQELEREHRLAQRSAAELEAIFQAMPDGVIIYDQEGRIVRSNRTGEELTGFHRESHALPIQERWGRVRVEHPDGRPLKFDEIPSAQALQGTEVKGEILIFSPEEDRRAVVSLSAAPILFEGKIVGVASTFSDISGLQELQEQHRIFVQMISHDLRTPLTVIQGHAEMLNEAVAAGPARVNIEGILGGVQRMTRMMEDLLDMARLERGQVAVDPQPVDPVSFVSDFLRRHAISMDVARVRLSLQERLPPVRADSMALERVLANLLTNALKYSQGAVRISACRLEQEVRFSVADRGAGIDGDELPRIFERFFRARGGAGTKGLGLGLYISRLLVEAHGGRIWALSRPETGTVFFFTLPIPDPEST